MPPEAAITDEGQGINPGSLIDTLGIDMVELGNGCAVNCASCGASPDQKVQPISIEQLEANITQVIENVRTGAKARLVDLFRSFITTGVDMEPVGKGIFTEAAELINRLSGGKSKVVAISHGLTCHEKGYGVDISYESIPGEREKLERINQLMLEDVVPLFVLSMDSSRRQGLSGKTAARYHRKIAEMEAPGSEFMAIVESQAMHSQKDDKAVDESPRAFAGRRGRAKDEIIEAISRKMLVTPRSKLNHSEEVVADYITARNKREDAVVENNARGYAETIYTLLPAITAGKRVTISLQGDNNKDSLSYEGLATKILQRTSDLLHDEYGMSYPEVNSLLESLNITLPRPYYGTGNATKLLGVPKGTGKCAVVPDDDFRSRYMGQNQPKVNRGRIRADGTLEYQIHRAAETYSDTVDSVNVNNPWKVVNLTRARITQPLSVFGSKVEERSF